MAESGDTGLNTVPLFNPVSTQVWNLEIKRKREKVLMLFPFLLLSCLCSLRETVSARDRNYWIKFYSRAWYQSIQTWNYRKSYTLLTCPFSLHHYWGALHTLPELDVPSCCFDVGVTAKGKPLSIFSDGMSLKKTSQAPVKKRVHKVSLEITACFPSYKNWMQF